MQVKDQILQKSAELFLALGVNSVTMDDIARDLGISKKTIYTFFSTKADLVEATSLEIFDSISSGIKEIQNQGKNPIEELFIIKDFAFRNLNNEKSSPQYQLQKYYPAISARIKNKQQKLLENCLNQNLHRGIEQGLYHQEIPVSFVSRFYFLGIIGIRDRDLFPESSFPMTELIEKHLEYHLRAIVTEKGLQTVMNFTKIQN